MPKKNMEKPADNTYGGVRYRFSYDSFRKAAGVRQIRLRKRGIRSFWLTVGVVSLFSVCTLAVSLVYKSADKSERLFSDNKGNLSDGNAVTVSSQVVSGNMHTYPKCFAVSDMDQRARDLYHLPEGVVISKVYHREDGINGDTVMDGDIITAVNGVQTHNTDSFKTVFDSARGKVNFTVYRKEKNLNFEYVIDDEE